MSMDQVKDIPPSMRELKLQLRPIVNGLSRRYPSDAYEQWAFELFVVMLIVLVVGLTDMLRMSDRTHPLEVIAITVLSFLMPLCVVLPGKLWGRSPLLPRWAHDLARMDPADQASFEKLLARLAESDFGVVIECEQPYTGRHVYFVARMLGVSSTMLRRSFLRPKGTLA